jgi:prefoldin subunit 5
VKDKHLAHLKSHIDIGCGVHALAKGRTDHFIVKTGVKDLWVSLTPDEALPFIANRLSTLHRQIREAREEVAKVRAHISTVRCR